MRSRSARCPADKLETLDIQTPLDRRNWGVDHRRGTVTAFRRVFKEVVKQECVIRRPPRPRDFARPRAQPVREAKACSTNSCFDTPNAYRKSSRDSHSVRLKMMLRGSYEIAVGLASSRHEPSQRSGSETAADRYSYRRLLRRAKYDPATDRTNDPGIVCSSTAQRPSHFPGHFQRTASPNARGHVRFPVGRRFFDGNGTSFCFVSSIALLIRCIHAATHSGRRRWPRR